MPSETDIQKTLVGLSSRELWTDLRNSFLFKLVATPGFLAFLYFGQNQLPFPFPHLFHCAMVNLVVNAGLLLYMWLARDPAWLHRVIPYVDVSFYPLAYIFSGGFMSPFILLVILSVGGSPILYTRDRAVSRNIFLISLIGYVLVCGLQKLGLYRDLVPFSLELIEQDLFFYFVVATVLLCMAGGYILSSAIHTNLSSVVTRSTKVLQNMVQGTSANVGVGFFETLVSSLTQAIGCRGAFVARTEKDGRTHSLAGFYDGRSLASFEIELKGNSLKSLVRGEEGKRFLAGQCRIFLLQDSQGEDLGCLGILLRKGLGQAELAESVVDVFSARAGAELVRIRDDEEKSHLQSALSQAQRLEAIGRLAGGVAHDFNNILAAVSGYVSLIKIKHPRQDPDVTAKLDGILEASSRAGKLTRNLLNFARETHFESKPVDIHESIHQMVRLFRAAAGKGVEIDLKLNAKESWFLGDSVQIERALLNIGMNARDAMNGQGKFIIETQDVIKAEGDKDSSRHLVIRLSDDGTGMNEETQSKIFQPFFTTKAPNEGSGFGLASVYGSIKAQGGRIEVSSELGHGSTFKIFLPALQVSAIQKSPVQGSKSATGRASILVVDDDDSVLEITREMLVEGGFNVVTCPTGTKGLKYYKDNPGLVDLVLLDMSMPGMDGQECFMKMKKINPELKALVMTGKRPYNILRSMQSEGLLGWLPKPIEHKNLLGMVNEALDGKANSITKAASGQSDKDRG